MIGVYICVRLVLWHQMGIVGLTNTLAREGAKKNVFVNCIAPTAASRMTEVLTTDSLYTTLCGTAIVLLHCVVPCFPPVRPCHLSRSMSLDVFLARVLLPAVVFTCAVRFKIPCVSLYGLVLLPSGRNAS